MESNNSFSVMLDDPTDRSGNKDERLQISIRNYLLRLKRINSALAHELKVSQADISRCALYIGVTELWNIFDDSINYIDDCRQQVYKSGNTWLLNFFENGHFDLKSDETTKFTGKFSEKDILMCKALASKAGTTYSTVYQISFAVGYLRAKEINPNDNQFCYDIVVRFGRWLEERKKHSKELLDTAQNNTVIQSIEPYKTISDVRKNLSDL